MPPPRFRYGAAKVDAPRRLFPTFFFHFFFRFGKTGSIVSRLDKATGIYLTVASRSSKVAGLHPGHYSLYAAGDSPGRDYGSLCTRRETLLAAAIVLSARGGRPSCPRLFARRDGKVLWSLSCINQFPPLHEFLKTPRYDTADSKCACTRVNANKRPPTAVPLKSAGARDQHRCTSGSIRGLSETHVVSEIQSDTVR